MLHVNRRTLMMSTSKVYVTTKCHPGESVVNQKLDLDLKSMIKVSTVTALGCSVKEAPEGNGFSQPFPQTLIIYSLFTILIYSVFSGIAME